jgi:hypothetical protein
MKFSSLRYIGFALNMAILIVSLGIVGIATSLIISAHIFLPYSIPFIGAAITLIILALLSFGAFLPTKWMRWTLPLIGLVIVLITYYVMTVGGAILTIGFILEILGGISK